jgi:hypothetical protein
MKNLRSTVAVLACCLGALIASPAITVHAQFSTPPGGVVVLASRVGSTITGTGTAQTAPAADAAAAANLAAERNKIIAKAKGNPVFFGPITTQRTILPGWWPFYRSSNRTTMTQTWSY